MREWIENGCRLAWLLDPASETAYVYRENGSVDVIETYDNPLDGENILPGFTFDLGELRS